MNKYKYLTIFSIVFTIILLTFSLIEYLKDERKDRIDFLHTTVEQKAKLLFDTVVVVRAWNAQHEAVYIKNEKLNPNKYLHNNQAFTNENEKLLKVNPAWMTRQIAQILKNNHDYSFNLTSLNPKNPNNKPNSFEKEALTYLVNNPEKKYYIKKKENFSSFEFMGVLKATPSCLKCHQAQNYKLGDTVGGISINLPIKNYQKEYQKIIDRKNTSINIIILIAIVFIILLSCLIHLIFKKHTKMELHAKELDKLREYNETLIKRYKYAVEGSQNGIWDWNLVTNEVVFDENWKKMLGYKDNEMPNALEEWEKRVHPDDKEAAIKSIEDNQNKKTSYYVNIHRLKHKNGTWVWILDSGKTYFDEHGKAIRMVGFHADITELKNLERRLSEKEQNLMDAQRIAHMGHWRFNEDTKEFVVSQTLYKLLGIDESKKFESYEDFYDFIYEKDKDKFIKNHKNIFENKENSTHIFRIINQKTNKKMYIEEHISCVLNEVTKEENYLGIMQDITSIKKSEKQIREKDELLLLQSKNAAMGEMISMIAHQWRQPITTISMLANNMKADIELESFDENEATNTANELIKQTQYLSHTIEDFRNFFKKDTKPELLDIEQLFSEIDSIIGASLKNNNIKLTTSYDKNIEIKTYKRDLLQVLINLVKNAKEALENVQREEKVIDIKIEEKDDRLVIVVKDNANGIPNEAKDKIFEAYFSTKTSQNGTGLGLYMSKMILEKHLNGTIDFKNCKGACFTISLQKFI